MLTKHLLPKSTATEPIDILIDVCRAILREPRRYYQGDWIRAVEPGEKLRLSSDFAFTRRIHSVKAPACGTVCCVAGWVRVLKRGKGENPKNLSARESICSEAAIILGKGHNIGGMRHGLFDGRAIIGTPGTKEYVERGIQHIENSMRRDFGYSGPALFPMLTAELRVERAVARAKARATR